jgi:GT2 family glycosyltransferase
MIASDPYISVAFVNRNDGYGGDLEDRIGKFISYYARFTDRWPGLFEFVVVDWNPPTDRAELAEAFQWERLGSVTHVTVPPDLHAVVAGERGRKMLDYFGRNVAIRHSTGEYSLVLNQDIFISETILSYLAARSLSDKHFYRADRCDFDFEPCRDRPPESLEDCAARSTFMVHRRHRSTDEPISVAATSSSIDELGFFLEAGDVFDPATGIIHCGSADLERRYTRNQLLRWRFMPWRRKALASWMEMYKSERYHRQFYLHTNAAGDFLLAPRKAFVAIHGFLESLEIYMHTDSYAMVQLAAAGYRQAIFTRPHRVYHADHDRSARMGFVEAMSWTDHEKVLSRIMRGEQSFRLNGESWGLADRALLTRHLRTGSSPKNL